MASVFLFVFFLLSHHLLLLSAQKCEPFHCGNLGEIHFPFTNYTNPACGVFSVDCQDQPNPAIQLEELEVRGRGRTYEVTNITFEDNNSSTIRVVYAQLLEDLNSSRCKSFTNLTIPNSAFFSFEIAQPKLTLFKCNRGTPFKSTPLPPNNFSKKNCIDEYNIYHSNSSESVPSSPSGCSIIQLPKNLSSLSGDDNPFWLLTEFDLGVRVNEECYTCHKNGGQCKSGDKGKFSCDYECHRCPNRGRQCSWDDKGKVFCVEKETESNTKPQAIGLGVGGAFIFTICAFILIRHHYKKKYASSNMQANFSSNNIICFWKKESLNHQAVQAFLRNHGPLAIKRYNYSNIKKMTNFFKDKLGEGGCGGVYKGKLQDGCLVAVKVLKESRDNGDEFINEVASISRTSHVNIVSLMGFCFEGAKRALIYQFMPNGSLEKFIYKESALTNDRRLEWETLYKIALGIARGLEYLHRGCNTQILHFDIKPHNILLDENFCPKISDFGLAKICPREKSIVSMLGTRGTAGYIAPEVFCRHFGNVSHKSDVYSYGMMVFEMVGERRNIDADIDHTSEIFFPHWIYKRLEQDEDLGLQSLMNEKDHESARKMIIISLWCIQSNPSIRPSMSSVVNMLEGSLESLQIPPKPFLSSPSSSPKDSSTTMGSLQYNSVMS